MTVMVLRLNPQTSTAMSRQGLHSSQNVLQTFRCLTLQFFHSSAVRDGDIQCEASGGQCP